MNRDEKINLLVNWRLDNARNSVEDDLPDIFRHGFVGYAVYSDAELDEAITLHDLLNDREL